MTSQQFAQKYVNEHVPLSWCCTPSKIFWANAYKKPPADCLDMARDFLSIPNLPDVNDCRSVQYAKYVLDHVKCIQQV